MIRFTVVSEPDHPTCPPLAELQTLFEPRYNIASEAVSAAVHILAAMAEHGARSYFGAYQSGPGGG